LFELCEWEYWLPTELVVFKFIVGDGTLFPFVKFDEQMAGSVEFKHCRLCEVGVIKFDRFNLLFKFDEWQYCVSVKLVMFTLLIGEVTLFAFIKFGKLSVSVGFKHCNCCEVTVLEFDRLTLLFKLCECEYCVSSELVVFEVSVWLSPSCAIVG